MHEDPRKVTSTVKEIKSPNFDATEINSGSPPNDILNSISEKQIKSPLGNCISPTGVIAIRTTTVTSKVNRKSEKRKSSNFNTCLKRSLSDLCISEEITKKARLNDSSEIDLSTNKLLAIVPNDNEKLLEISTTKTSLETNSIIGIANTNHNKIYQGLLNNNVQHSEIDNRKNGIRRHLKHITRKDLEDMIIEQFMNKILYDHELGYQHELCKRLESTLESANNKALKLTKEVARLKDITEKLAHEHEKRKSQFVIPVKVKRSVGLQVNEVCIETTKSKLVTPSKNRICQNNSPNNVNSNTELHSTKSTEGSQETSADNDLRVLQYESNIHSGKTIMEKGSTLAFVPSSSNYSSQSTNADEDDIIIDNLVINKVPTTVPLPMTPVQKYAGFGKLPPKPRLRLQQKNKKFGMAHSDFWGEGRILIAGDSRVRRLMSNPDVTLSEKVDYAFEGGVLINDLVLLVDNNLNDHHKVIILLGLVGDEIQKYIHYVTPNDTVSLIRSKECDASESILIAVKAASSKWISLRSDRIVLWMIPHYVDYVAYNTQKIGEYEAGESLEISLDSSRRFVNYVTRLKLRWVTECPEVPFGLLNRVLFLGKQSKKLYNSFSAVSATNYQFPIGRLTDGLHPTVDLARDIWSFLHKSVSEVHDKLTGRKVIRAPSSTSSSPTRIQRSPRRNSFKAQLVKRSHFSFRNPYTPKKIDLNKLQSSVHSRLSLPHESKDVIDALGEEPLESYGNLSWKSSESGSIKSTSKSAPLGFVQQGPAAWSWAIHNQRLNAVKTEVYTQGLESQKRAEGRLADIIRDRGLKLAEQGQFDTVNAASRSWLTNLHSEMNSPAPGAKLVQKEIAQLLPVEGDKSSSSDTD